MVAQHEAPGASNRELRALLKANIDYANKIQHDRAGTRDQARAVAESTIAAVSLVRLVLVAAPETDAEAMREAWLVTIIPAVELHSIPLAAILREARPVELDRERIVVAFPGHASFHFQLAQEPKNTLLLREVLESVLGRSIEIEFKLAELDA
jgi:hypothetical protein